MPCDGCIHGYYELQNYMQHTGLLGLPCEVRDIICRYAVILAYDLRPHKKSLPSRVIAYTGEGSLNEKQSCWRVYGEPMHDSFRIHAC
jgi:hypothetical protein